jgi:NAD(P)-dependent dehydrogenase (short-subunit alcohol dehydrogenase family)
MYLRPRFTIQVTGSARGIGRAIALRLARDGYDMVVNDVSANQSLIDETVKEIEGVGRKAWGIPADVSNFDDVKRLVDETVQKSGRLDVMVANAGVTAVKPLADMVHADLKRVFDINVGVAWCG